MNEKFVERFISNCNPKSFLPQNLSLNLLDFMVNEEDDPNSVIFLIHAVTILYKNRFNLPINSPNSEIHNTFLFKSSLKKYILVLAQELDLRSKQIKRPQDLTLETVLF